MPHFNLEYRVVTLPLKHPFGISRSTRTEVENVFVSMEAGGYRGFGEAAPSSRYGEDAKAVCDFIEQLPGDFFDEIQAPEQLAVKLDVSTPPVQSARVALEMAWLDWWGKKHDSPLWELWDAPSNTGPVTSFTIGLDKLDKMAEKVREAKEYPVLKVKLGDGRDRDIIETIRKETTRTLRVDANEGWKNLEEAGANIEYLESQQVELVEQPMPAGQVEDLKALKAQSPLPICADESFEGDEDLDIIKEAFHCINIKLMKTGSLVKGLDIIKNARAADLKIMIGCMVESSLADTASALLSLWADYADLDGHLLIEEDPFHGFRLDEHKRVVIDDRPGLGIHPSRELFG